MLVFGEETADLIWSRSATTNSTQEYFTSVAREQSLPSRERARKYKAVLFIVCIAQTWFHRPRFIHTLAHREASGWAKMRLLSRSHLRWRSEIATNISLLHTTSTLTLARGLVYAQHDCITFRSRFAGQMVRMYLLTSIDAISWFLMRLSSVCRNSEGFSSMTELPFIQIYLYYTDFLTQIQMRYRIQI